MGQVERMSVGRGGLNVPMGMDSEGWGEREDGCARGAVDAVVKRCMAGAV